QAWPALWPPIAVGSRSRGSSLPRPVSVNSTSMSGRCRLGPPRRLDTLVQANHDVPSHRLRARAMDIVVWLRSLGLGKYEAAFRENEIDETVLPSLTHETLKELGVTAVGHRLKLLDAIAALRTDASAQHPSPTVAAARQLAATTTQAPIAEAAGERRHITVMFCDLVGSTSVSAGLDAEEWRDLVGAYLDAATAA